MKHKLLVLGGSGYIGEKICEEALKKEHYVTGLSRHGIPAELKTVPKEKLKWINGDALNKDAYANDVLHSTGILHCIGILFEKVQIPFLKKEKKTDTYETVNRETALKSLEILEKSKKSGSAPIPFCFLSAGQSIPLFPNYLKAKKDVEMKMAQLEAKSIVRPIILKPGLVYDDKIGPKYILAQALNQIYTVDNYLGKHFGHKLGVVKPVNLNCLAKAAINGIETPGIKGQFDSEAIEKLGKCNAEQ